jgi:hypothetical protein
MAGDDEMTVDERRKYLKRMHARYWAADRRGRGELLDEMEMVTGMHRKSLIRLIRGPTLERKKRRGGRGVTYGNDVRYVVSVVWEALDYVCAERLTPSLLPMAKHLERFEEVQLTSEIEEKLGRISRPTVQRMLTRMPREKPRLPRAGPERANGIRREVPMRRLPWDEQVPGHCETDLVHHCGPSLHGQYVHTLQLIDVATAWSERVALLGRSETAMIKAFNRVIVRVPFPIVELHPDSGSEFYGVNLVRLWGDKIAGLKLSRSRPYQSNDNRFVEQKNDTLVRAYLGNDRLDTQEQVRKLNKLYDHMWTYYNLFQPVLRLADKQIVDGKLRRTWDEPATPYERLRATGVLDDDRLQELDSLLQATNPRRLRKLIYDGIYDLWSLEPQVPVLQQQPLGPEAA